MIVKTGKIIGCGDGVAALEVLVKDSRQFESIPVSAGHGGQTFLHVCRCKFANEGEQF